MAITVVGTASTQIGTGVTQLSWTHNNGYSGADLNAIVVDDYDGVSRPDSPDCGAYEFV